LPSEGKAPARLAEVIPENSYAWKQGIYWKYIPPPYDMDKPITMPKGVAPQGAKIGGRTPQETIQMVGLKEGVTPKDVSIDLGVVDAFITAGGTRITFAGKGEGTNVGTRIPSTTKGMSVFGEGVVEGEGELERWQLPTETYFGMPKRGRGVSRVSMRRKQPSRKKRNWLNEVTRPPTRQEMMR